MASRLENFSGGISNSGTIVVQSGNKGTALSPAGSHRSAAAIPIAGRFPAADIGISVLIRTITGDLSNAGTIAGTIRRTYGIQVVNTSASGNITNSGRISAG